MIKMNKRFLFPLASGITFVLLICGSLTIIENKAHAQLPGLLVSCGVGQHASPTGVCCPEGMDAVHSMCMTQQQIQAREENGSVTARTIVLNNTAHAATAAANPSASASATTATQISPFESTKLLLQDGISALEQNKDINKALAHLKLASQLLISVGENSPSIQPSKILLQDGISALEQNKDINKALAHLKLAYQQLSAVEPSVTTTTPVSSSSHSTSEVKIINKNKIPPIPNRVNVVDKIVSLCKQYQAICGTPMCSSVAPSVGIDAMSCVHALPSVRTFFNILSRGETTTGSIKNIANSPHCDIPGYPSCYNVGLSAGLDSGKSFAKDGNDITTQDVRDICQGHSKNWCHGFSLGYKKGFNSVPYNSGNGTPQTSLPDPSHCDRPGYPSCYTVGYKNGQNQGNAKCPSGHSKEFCRGWNNSACTSDGCGGDYTCINPNQPAGVPGCPNDSLQSGLYQAQPLSPGLAYGTAANIGPMVPTTSRTGQGVQTLNAKTTDPKCNTGLASQTPASCGPTLEEYCNNNALLCQIGGGLLHMAACSHPLTCMIATGIDSWSSINDVLTNPSPGTACNLLTTTTHLHGILGKSCDVIGNLQSLNDMSTSSSPDNTNSAPVDNSPASRIQPTPTSPNIEPTMSDRNAASSSSPPSTTTNQPPNLAPSCSDNPAIGFSCPSPPTTTPSCSNGSVQDANCAAPNPTLAPQVDCTANPNDSSCPQPAASTCPDGSAPASDGTCPTPQTQQQPQTCSDGSAPASDGTCPSSTPTPIDPCTQDPNAAGCNTSPPPVDNSQPSPSPDNTNNAPVDNSQPSPSPDTSAPSDNSGGGSTDNSQSSPPPDNTNNAPTDNTSPQPDNSQSSPDNSPTSDNSGSSSSDNSKPSVDCNQNPNDSSCQ